MLNTYSILPEYGLLWKRYFGNVTQQQLADLGQQVMSDRRYDRTMSVFDDMRGLKTLDIDYNHISALSRDVRGGFGDCPAPVKFAICAPGDLAYGLGRMFQTLMSDFDKLDIGVFRDIDETLDFLDIPDTKRPMLRCGDPEMAEFF